jgi:hypothetical protein
MADLHRPRLDGYGRPLPRLLDPDTRARGGEMNRQQQQLIDRLLQEEYDALLVQGVYAEVTLSFVVKDGVLGMDVYTLRCQQHRTGEEEP